MTSHASDTGEGARTEHRSSGPARLRIPPTVDILSMHDASLEAAAVPSAPTSEAWSQHGAMRDVRGTASGSRARAPCDFRRPEDDPTSGRTAEDARAQDARQRHFLEMLDEAMRDGTPDEDDRRRGWVVHPAPHAACDGEAS